MSNFSDWLKLLEEQITHIDAIQCAVLIFGVTEVLCARVNSIWLYPSGIIATALAILSLYDARLYAECLLHFYYIIMSVYGWWYWTTPGDRPPVQVTFANRQDWVVTFIIVVAGWAILYFVVSSFTDSEVPAWDAWITSTAWAGMWLLARRKVENWILLNVSNAFAIPLMFHKQLPLFALLTIFLFIVACKGYFDWIKVAKNKHSGIASGNEH